jgi:hypothetical protein
MARLDKKAAREIALSDLVPGFSILYKEKPALYNFDEKAFSKLGDAELLSMVEHYSSLVQKGMGWKAAVTQVYEKARADSLKGFK